MSTRERRLRDGWRARWVAKHTRRRALVMGIVLPSGPDEHAASPPTGVNHGYRCLCGNETASYPEHHLPQAPDLQRFGAIVDAGFPPDVADLYVKTPSWPRHPDIREVRAGLARQRAEKRAVR